MTLTIAKSARTPSRPSAASRKPIPAPDTPLSGGWNAAKVAAFERGFWDFVSRVKINSKEKGGGYQLSEKTLYVGQRRFIRALFDGLAQDKHVIKCLKSRQLGMSTIVEIFTVYWLGVHDGMKGGLVFDTGPHTSGARRRIKSIIKNLPPTYHFPAITDDNREGLVLENESQLIFMSAGVRETASSGTLGRSEGLNFLWASEICHAAGTPVLVENGWIKNIEDVQPGERVITHTGAVGVVTANIKKHCPWPLVMVKPYLSPPIYATPDHEILTRRGKVKACDLRADDLVTMPVRRIETKQTTSFLPGPRIRRQGGGTVAASAGMEVALDEELGFAIGYYLSEGSILYQRRGEHYYDDPSGLVFTRHRGETAYADRAANAIRKFTTGIRITKHVPNSLSTQEFFYGSAFATWVEEKFGAREKKRIPDEVFEWGIEFCRGLFCGLLSGDGSKIPSRQGQYTRHKTSITTTRSSIATQARDLALSLGYGWGGLTRRDGGVWYGRVCKESWTVTWHGKAGEAIRAAMGLPSLGKKRRKEPKWFVDGSTLFVELKRLETGMIPVAVPVYDLSVNHTDHTFRTASFSTSNCSWKNTEGLKALSNSLSDNYPDREYIWESTARGFNEWHDIWNDALNNEIEEVAYFAGWWAKDDQRIRRGTPLWNVYGVDPPTPDEERRIRLVDKLYDFRVDQEQLAWYRRYIDPNRDREEDEPEDGYAIQDQPWVAEESFQQAGVSFFRADKLTLATEACKRLRPIGQYRFWPGDSILNCNILPSKTWKEVELKVWEEPVSESAYVVAGDPAYGRNELNNNSCAQVLRCYADAVEQVAEFTSPIIEPHQFAWLLWTLVGWYASAHQSEVIIICELNGSGEEVLRQYNVTRALLRDGYLRTQVREAGLNNLVHNGKSYIYGRSDSMNSGHNWWWKTTSQLKVQMMDGFRGYFHNDMVLIRSYDALEEMKTIAREGDKIGAPSGKRDDRNSALAFGVRAWEERLRRNLSRQNRTREADRIRRAGSNIDIMGLFHKNLLQDMLRRKEAGRRDLALAALRRPSFRIR